MSSWYPLIKWLHIVSSTVLFGRCGHCVLLSAGAAVGGFENYRGGQSGRGVGRYGVHCDGRGDATGDRHCAVVDGRVPAVNALARIVDGALWARRVLLAAGRVAADANARLGD